MIFLPLHRSLYRGLYRQVVILMALLLVKGNIFPKTFGLQWLNDFLESNSLQPCSAKVRFSRTSSASMRPSAPVRREVDGKKPYSSSAWHGVQQMRLGIFVVQRSGFFILLFI